MDGLACHLRIQRAEVAMGRLFALRTLIKSGRLALRLLRDERVPVYSKLILGLGVLYVVSPLDFLPDWFPILGQLDDLAAIAAGVALFIRACPPEIVEEHELRLGRRPRTTIEGQARPV
jgi:uncharacterized membrane protein YkvA (DUF1232 family)